MGPRCAIPRAELTAMNKLLSGRGIPTDRSSSVGRDDYVRQVLEAYRTTPGTCGHLRRPDRLLAIQLYARGIPLDKVENALVLAALRRLILPAPRHRALPGLLPVGHRRSA